MERILIVLGVVALVSAAAVMLGTRLVRQRRAKHTALMRAKVSALRSAVRHWSGSVEDLVKCDSDRQPGTHSFRTIELRPCSDELWRVLILAQERYRLEVISTKDRVHCYPARVTWSDEPWLKKEIDLLLWEIDQVPTAEALEKRKAMLQHEIKSVVAHLLVHWERLGDRGVHHSTSWDEQDPAHPHRTRVKIYALPNAWITLEREKAAQGMTYSFTYTGRGDAPLRFPPKKGTSDEQWFVERMEGLWRTIERLSRALDGEDAHDWLKRRDGTA